jgi:hypothetical protein
MRGVSSLHASTAASYAAHIRADDPRQAENWTNDLLYAVLHRERPPGS